MNALLRRLLPMLRKLKPRRCKSPATDPWLDRPLVRLSKHDVLDTRAACENVLVLGANGSGKTSGVGGTVGLSYLREGRFGMTVLCVKGDEPDWWIDLARDAGRSDDVVIFGHPDNSPWRFNVLDYERTRGGGGAGLTENITTLLIEVGQVLERGRSGGGRENDKFWEANEKALIRNAVELCLLSDTPLSVETLRRIVLSAPTSPEQAQSDEWRRLAYCWKLLLAADKHCTSNRHMNDLGVVADYWLKVFPETSDKTRSIFVTAFNATTDLLSRGILRELFCTETNITPDALADGKIIILALPIKEYGDVGRAAATLWKQAVQRFLERRDVRTSPRPVCIWMDEAAHLITPGEMLYASSCRSVRGALVLMGHNIGSFHVAFGGGETGRAETDGLLGLMNTKIFCANSDTETCTWAADLIGKAPRMFLNASSSNQGQDWLGAMTGLGEPPSTNAGMSEQMDYLVSPWEFSKLRTGSAHNDYCVDTIVVRSGRLFQSTGTHWMPVTFQQR